MGLRIVGGASAGLCLMTAPFAALVADDDPMICRVLQHQLGGFGAQRVDTAGSGRAALEVLARAGDISLLISDLQMPDMDGIELLRALTQLDRPLAVIVVSSMGAKSLRAAEQLARGGRLQILGSLPKPPGRQALGELLARWDRATTEPGPVPAAPAASGLTARDIADALPGEPVEIHAQPQIGVNNGELSGVEILGRWPTGRLAGISPGAIFAAAESDGDIGALTERILTLATAAAQSWREMGIKPQISINISALSLQDEAFPERCLELVRGGGLEPEQVVLEVTESALAHNADLALAVATRLHLRGFELAIDDYGAGYANLLKLREMPFGELKLDGALVRRLPDEEESCTIVASSLNMARSLELRTVAEGVETPEQLRWLRKAGCDVAQGFLFSPSMPIHSLPGWARENLPARIPD